MQRNPWSRRWAAALGLVALVIVPQAPLAWEAATTHAGLVEQAALSSALHGRLERDVGLGGGLFARLVVPPKDAPATIELLRKFNPTHGYVPDDRGQQMALGWLAAGAALADSPPSFAANHFFDPKRSSGLDDHTLRELTERAKHSVDARRVHETLIRSGVPAIQWVTSKDNPLGLQGFHDQYRKALTARTAGERERHLAGALLAAGAIVHVVQDMASPSHVRVDLAAHLDPLGASNLDVGSRLENIAALAYGRLGIPGPTHVVHKDHLAGFFADSDGSGLAQVVAQSYFSRYTLPAPLRLPPGSGPGAVALAVQRALGRDDVTMRQDGARVRVADSTGTCIALFRTTASEVEFSTDDRCVLSQLETLLPLAVDYGTGALDFLFRGQLSLSAAERGLVVTSALGLGDGELQLLWDDAQGVRASFHRAQVRGKLPASLPSGPSGATRVIAVFVGTDAHGEDVVAVGSWAPSP